MHAHFQRPLHAPPMQALFQNSLQDPLGIVCNSNSIPFLEGLAHNPQLAMHSFHIDPFQGGLQAPLGIMCNPHASPFSKGFAQNQHPSHFQSGLHVTFCVMAHSPHASHFSEELVHNPFRVVHNLHTMSFLDGFVCNPWGQVHVSCNPF